MRRLRALAAHRPRHGGLHLSGEERYELPPERLGRWLDRWAEAHGGLAASAVDDARRVVTHTGRDGATVTCEPPFPPLAPGDDLLAHVARERNVGVLLVRLGGHAAGVFAGTRLVASKTGARLVHGRHRVYWPEGADRDEPVMGDTCVACERSLPTGHDTAVST